MCIYVLAHLCVYVYTRICVLTHTHIYDMRKEKDFWGKKLEVSRERHRVSEVMSGERQTPHLCSHTKSRLKRGYTHGMETEGDPRRGGGTGMESREAVVEESSHRRRWLCVMTSCLVMRMLTEM